MLRDQVITFLEATVIFLLLTNAVSVVAAAYAIAVATGLNNRRREAKALVVNKANAVLSAMWPSTAADRGKPPMRQAFTPGSRVAVLAIMPTASDGRLAGLWRKFVKDLFDPYRPELHYMRGPGPKWREKHGIADPR